MLLILVVKNRTDAYSNQNRSTSNTDNEKKIQVC